jgi:catechol 2,3-dioxygenase-like lactoylglutathione lyase family enzyme
VKDVPPQLELYTTILRVSNLERSVEWYSKVFGLQPVYRDLSYRLASMVGGKGQRITLREATGNRAVEPMRLEGAYVVFVTTDAEAMHNDLIQRGFSVGSVEDHPGVRLFWVPDPDGHQLCVLQFLFDY